MSVLGRLFGGIDGLFRGIRRAIRSVWRWFVDGPGQGIAFWLIIGITGLIVLILLPDQHQEGSSGESTDEEIARLKERLAELETKKREESA